MEKENEGTKKADAPIEIKNLRKAFGEQTVLNGINLRVARGETLAVLGRSGTGKSVLLKLIMGLQQPDAGSVRLADQEIIGLEEDALNQVRKKVGYLFQGAALYSSLTVEENVAFPLSRHTTMTDAERKKRVRELLSEVGMERDLEKLPSQLSGGMQKRVGLARALALEPEILLFDEPTAGLDPITASEVGELIVALREKMKKMSAVVVTHDVEHTKVFSDRLALLHQGSIRAEGTLDELRASRDELVTQFLGQG